MNLPVFDLHCDTALNLIGTNGEPAANLRRNGGSIDLERGGRLAAYAQCFAFWTFPDMAGPDGLPPEEIFQAALRNFQRELEENAQYIAQARTGEEISAVIGQGKIAAVLTLEGTAGIGFDSERLEDLAALGFRMTTLTWNERNPLAGSHKTGGGLTERGREFVREAQRLGLIVDVSHLSDEAFWDLMDITRGPVCASHSNSRRIHPSSRNLTDEQFLAICQTGGVAGLNLYTDFLGNAPVGLDACCRHVLHWLELGGEKHIALGGDLDGCDSLPDGFESVQDYPRLAMALLENGVPENTIRDLYWNNAMGVLGGCCTSQQ